MGAALLASEYQKRTWRARQRRQFYHSHFAHSRHKAARPCRHGFCRRSRRGIAAEAAVAREQVLRRDRGDFLHAARIRPPDEPPPLARKWRADPILIEDTSTGMGLIQLVREHPSLNVIGRRPKYDKETRMARQQGRFEAGHVLLPKEAPWLPDFESELFAFPSDRYDDQVDALLAGARMAADISARVHSRGPPYTYSHRPRQRLLLTPAARASGCVETATDWHAPTREIIGVSGRRESCRRAEFPVRYVDFPCYFSVGNLQVSH